MPEHPLGNFLEGDFDYGSTITFVLAVLVLSNLLSNVPLILMMRPMLYDLPDKEAKAVWLVVAFVCEFCSPCVVTVLVAGDYIADSSSLTCDERSNHRG